MHYSFRRLATVAALLNAIRALSLVIELTVQVLADYERICKAEILAITVIDESYSSTDRRIILRFVSEVDRGISISRLKATLIELFAICFHRYGP